MLAKASERSAAEIYNDVDAHMLESTTNNMGISRTLKEKYKRVEDARQVFSNLHTSLGMIKGKNSVAVLEPLMGVDKICVS